jgi:TPR repeat protein
MFKYAIGLEKGNSRIVDKKEAMIWYKNAAKQENLQSICNHGFELENDYSVVVDNKEAMQ